MDLDLLIRIFIWCGFSFGCGSMLPKQSDPQQCFSVFPQSWRRS
jgi:hypothetical protein